MALPLRMDILLVTLSSCFSVREARLATAYTEGGGHQGLLTLPLGESAKPLGMAW